MLLSFLENNICQHDMEEITKVVCDYKKFFGTNIYISGATGMLASYLVGYFIYLNEKYGANIQIYAGARKLGKVKERFGKFVEYPFFHVILDDITKPFSLNISFDYIIHAASLASPQFYSKMPVEVLKPNVLGTYYLLECARNWHVKNFLFFSSGDVYGKIISGADNITEDMCGTMDSLAEHSCYGESKRMGENLCSSFAREYGVHTNIVRIGHTYGPTMDVDNDPRVFASFMKNCLDGKDIVMLSDGTAKRPFCYVSDAISAYLTVLLHGESGEAYNVTNPNEFMSIAEFANIISGLCREKISVIRKIREKTDNYLENTLNIGNCLSCEKLQKLGWHPQVSTKEGLKRCYEYLKVNPRQVNSKNKFKG